MRLHPTPLRDSRYTFLISQASLGIGMALALAFPEFNRLFNALHNARPQLFMVGNQLLAKTFIFPVIFKEIYT